MHDEFTISNQVDDLCPYEYNLDSSLFMQRSKAENSNTVKFVFNSMKYFPQMNEALSKLKMINKDSSNKIIRQQKCTLPSHTILDRRYGYQV